MIKDAARHTPFNIVYVTVKNFEINDVTGPFEMYACLYLMYSVRSMQKTTVSTSMQMEHHKFSSTVSQNTGNPMIMLINVCMNSKNASTQCRVPV